MYSTSVFATGLHLRSWKAFAVSAAADGDDEDDGTKLHWLLVLQHIYVYISESQGCFLRGISLLRSWMMLAGFFALMNVITGTYVETVSRQATDLKTRSQCLGNGHAQIAACDSSVTTFHQQLVISHLYSYDSYHLLSLVLK